MFGYHSIFIFTPLLFLPFARSERISDIFYNCAPFFGEKKQANFEKTAPPEFPLWAGDFCQWNSGSGFFFHRRANAPNSLKQLGSSCSHWPNKSFWTLVLNFRPASCVNPPEIRRVRKVLRNGRKCLPPSPRSGKRKNDHNQGTITESCKNFDDLKREERCIFVIFLPPNAKKFMDQQFALKCVHNVCLCMNH